MNWNAPFLRRLALIAILAAFTFWVLRFFNSLDDDSMIPMRYALNILRGNGWAMNPGERVEGTTSPFHVGWLTLLLRGLSPDGAIWAQKAIGWLLGLWVLTATIRVGDRVFRRPSVGLLGAGFLALRPEFALSMTNALETCWATFFIVVGLERWLAEDESSVPWSALAFAGAALTRPELALVLPCLLPFRFGRQYGVRSLAIFGVPVGCFLLFRLVTFGSFVPNTYFAKQMPFEEAWLPGMVYLSEHGAWLGAWLGLIGLGIAPLGLRWAKPAAPLAVLPGVGAVFIVFAGGTWMPDGRFLAPFMPVLFLVWAALAVQACQKARTQPLAVCVVALVVGIDTADRFGRLAAWPSMTSIFEASSSAPLGRWRCCQPDGRRRMAEWISKNIRPGQLVACSELGLPGLLNMDVRFLDLRGLTDARVAHMASCRRDQAGVRGDSWSDANGEITRYVLARRPEAVIVFDAGSGRDSGFAHAYTVVDHFDVVGEGGCVWPVDVWRLRP